MALEDTDLGNISFAENVYKSILIYCTSYKIFIGAKALSIIFDKVDGFVKIYDGTRHLELFGPEIYNASCNRIN